MIPLRLRLKNFLCYRDNVPPIPLEHIHLACLCGNNGAGKSALLDAMTWALWGKARSGGHHEGLIHSGQEEMEVELEFLVRGQRYRVIRKYARARPGRPARHLCDLQVADGAGFRSISGVNLRETQHKIEREVLRLDYETFINSAFLLQGRADEFTRKSPAERKEVLGQILGLSFYDELGERARERQRKSRDLAEELRRSLAELDAELEALPRYREERLRYRAELERLEERLERQEHLLRRLEERHKRLEGVRTKLEEVARSLRLVREEIDYRERERGELSLRLGEVEELLSRATEIESGYRSLLGLKEREEELEGKWREWHSLEERRRRLEGDILKVRGELEKRVAILGQESRRLRSREEELSRVEADLEHARAEVSRWEKEQERLDGLKEECRLLQEQAQARGLEMERNRVEAEELGRKLELLQEEGAACPLCGAELGPEGVERLREECRLRREEVLRTLAGLERERKEIERRLEERRRELEERERLIARRLPEARGRLLALERSREEIGRELSRREGVEAELVELSRRLAEEDFAAAERQELESVQGRLRELDYSIEEHEKVRKEVRRLSTYEEKFRRLEEGRREQPLLRAKLDRVSEEIAERRERARGMEDEIEHLKAELSALPEVERQLEAVRREREALERRRLELRSGLAVVEDRLRRCLELKELRAKKEAELRQAEEEEKIFGELGEAFGKRGVQALLIEQMLPLLEQEANALLSRLTEGRMSLRFQTQKITREGRALETLEIEIGDELGTRSYEMYSGGEAFRIDFALRVALARLIARRAGAPLPILIIDEGFGSQDAQGRERLVEAINAVAPEFEKVLVITHMEELKELFPVRIEVTRTEQGSMVRVFA